MYMVYELKIFINFEIVIGFERMSLQVILV